MAGLVAPALHDAADEGNRDGGLFGISATNRPLYIPASQTKVSLELANRHRVLSRERQKL
jgi:hypothetical protein